MPIPERMLKMGLPKQAEKAKGGEVSAMEVLTSIEVRELHTAKMVSPMIALERRKIKPKTYEPC